MSQNSDLQNVFLGALQWVGKNAFGTPKIVELTEDKFNQTIKYIGLREVEIKNLITLNIDYIEFAKRDRKSKFEESISDDIDFSDESKNYEIQPQNSTIRITIKLYDYNWWFIHGGKLQLLIDGVPLDLGRPKSRHSSTARINNEVAIMEIGLYFISVEDFKRLCDAEQVSFRLSGKNNSYENDFNQSTLDYFKSFYNQVFDNKLFTKELERFIFLEKENKKATKIGVGLGCILPILIFLIYIIVGAFVLDNKENDVLIPIMMKLMFGSLIIGWGVSFYIKFKAKSKAKELEQN